MSKKKASETSYSLQGIHVANVSFKRADVLNLESQKNNVHLDVDYKAKSNELRVMLQIKIEIFNDEEKQIDLDITTVGVFFYKNATEDDHERFGRINAPSVIFPFLREHVANLTARSNIPPILLPIVNWVALNQEQNKKTK